MTLATLPDDLERDWVAADGRARIEVFPKGDANDNATLRRFVAAVRALAPDATGAPVSIQESSRTIVARLSAGGPVGAAVDHGAARVTLRRAADVLLTLAPLVLSGLVTLGICVAIGLPLNFENIIALPLLFGIGVAFNIYFVMAWRAGRARAAAIEPDARGDLQRADHRDGVRQPVAVASSRDVEHGQAAGAVARVHAGFGRCCSCRRCWENRDRAADRSHARGPSPSGYCEPDALVDRTPRTRVSAHCQAMSPGKKMMTSRSRRAVASASAVVASMPSAAPIRTNPPSWTPSAPGTMNAALPTAWINASITTASSTLRCWPRKYRASQISPAPSTQPASCHAKHAPTSPRRS